MNEEEANLCPDAILIFSGKRKSGKDYTFDKLNYRLQINGGYNVHKITLAALLKETFAQENNLDYAEMLTSSDYKERYRIDLIKYIENKFNFVVFYHIISFKPF